MFIAEAIRRHKTSSRETVYTLLSTEESSQICFYANCLQSGGSSRTWDHFWINNTVLLDPNKSSLNGLLVSQVLQTYSHDNDFHCSALTLKTYIENFLNTFSLTHGHYSK